MVSSKDDVSELRIALKNTFEEFEIVYNITYRIRFALEGEDPFDKKWAVKVLRAYQQGIETEDVELESHRDLEERNKHRKRWQRELLEVEGMMEDRKEKLRQQLETQIRDLVGLLCEPDVNKKVKIIALKEAVESDLRGDVIADALDCSSGYPGQFRWNSDEQAVELRDDVEQRRKNRFSESKKNRIRQRDGSQCVNCGSENKLSVHHIIPIESGGTGELENGATLCASCHGEMHQWASGYGEYYDSIDGFWEWVES